MWNCIVNLDVKLSVIISQCKLFKKEELLRLIDENTESSEIWNRLIG